MEGTEFVGLNTLLHDSSVFRIGNGKVFALNRERLTRVKHDSGFPKEVLDMMNLKNAVFADNTNSTPYPAYAMHGLARSAKGPGRILAKSIRGPIRTANNILVRWHAKRRLKPYGKFEYELWDHHASHAASASESFGKKCAVLTLDAAGDGFCSKIFDYNGNADEFITGTKISDSIGEAYSEVTRALGFRRDSDEGKTEALAAYGKHTKLADKFLEGIDVKNGKVSISRTIMKANWYRLVSEHGKENVAYAIQKALEKISAILAADALQMTGRKDLALAGGCFANVIANMKIFEEIKPNSMHIFPAMGDDGSAAGAAILSARARGVKTGLDKMVMPYFGPEFEIKEPDKTNNITIRRIGDEWWHEAAELIEKDNVICLFQGRAEYGPRALGNRSVLASSMNPKVKDRINSTIKRRHWFQPFCPSILESERGRLFEKSYPNKHMTCAFHIRPEHLKGLISTSHIDGTARAQFVEKEDNYGYWKLLSELKKDTGYGAVLNTSFNLHGRPIVTTPAHAMQDFIDCGLDYMIMGEYLIKRNK